MRFSKKKTTSHPVPAFRFYSGRQELISLYGLVFIETPFMSPCHSAWFYTCPFKNYYFVVHFDPSVDIISEKRTFTNLSNSGEFHKSLKSD